MRRPHGRRRSPLENKPPHHALVKEIQREPPCRKSEVVTFKNSEGFAKEIWVVEFLGGFGFYPFFGSVSFLGLPMTRPPTREGKKRKGEDTC